MKKVLTGFQDRVQLALLLSLGSGVLLGHQLQLANEIDQQCLAQLVVQF